MSSVFKRTWTARELEQILPEYKSLTKEFMMPLEYARAVSRWCGASEVLILQVALKMVSEGKLEYQGGLIRVGSIDCQSELVKANVEDPTPPTGWELFRGLVDYYAKCVELDTGSSFSTTLDKLGDKFSFVDSEQSYLPEPHTALSWQLHIKPGDPWYFDELNCEREDICLGYPVYISSATTKAGDSSNLRIRPIFVWRLKSSVDPLTGEVLLTLSDPKKGPEVNLNWLSSAFGSKAQNRYVFMERCGLEGDTVSIDWSLFGAEDQVEEARKVTLEVQNWSVARLAEIIRTTFKTQETLNPLVKSTYPVTPDLPKGYYNKGLLFTLNESPFSKRLLEELRAIQKADDELLDQTALRYFFKQDELGGNNENLEQEDNPTYGASVLDVLDFTPSQRQAVASMLKSPLTVIQGPPGTGKSQVIAGAALNSIYYGQSVLISSLAHKAVSAVQERFDRLQSKYGDLPFIRCNNKETNKECSFEKALNDVLQNAISLSEEEKQHYGEMPENLHRLCQRRVEAEQAAIVIHNTQSRLSQSIEKLDRLTQNYPWLPEAYQSFKASYRVFDTCLAQLKTNQNKRFGYVLWHFFCPRVFKRWCHLLTQKAKLPTLPSIGELPSKEQVQTLEQFNEQLKQYVLSKEEKRHCREVLEKNEPTSADPQTIIRDQTQEIVNILPEYFASQVRVLQAQANQNAHQLRNLRIELSEERFRNASWRLSHDNAENIRGLETVALQSLPIWGVTALSAGKYLPITAGLFDLVVIDEATQMNIAQAIPLLFRAKRAAIVGDPKQLSFITHLGNRNDGQLRRLFKVHGLSLNRFKYSEFSLYDFAHSTPDAYRVFLSETFRSCSPIANYSSAYFYDESLEVATDEKQLKVPAFYKAGIDWCDATGEILQGVNHRSCYSEAEVKAVTDIVVSILRGAEFDGTLGVVTPFAAQARKIEESLELEFRKDRTRLDKAQLMVDTAHAFQGSERDVMIFSLCANANMPTGSMNFLREGKNIFNVAASRARSLLYVVGDKKWAEMCGIDFIQGLTKDWNRWSSQKYSRWAPYESPWEKKLAEKLLEHGLEVQPQWRVGCRRLDLALMEGAAKLDIEVDGETYHRDENNRRRADDFFRDEYLQRFGWKTQRFWVSELQDDLEGCALEVVKVWNLLKTKVS